MTANMNMTMQSMTVRLPRAPRDFATITSSEFSVFHDLASLSTLNWNTQVSWNRTQRLVISQFTVSVHLPIGRIGERWVHCYLHCQRAHCPARTYWMPRPQSQRHSKLLWSIWPVPLPAASRSIPRRKPQWRTVNRTKLSLIVYFPALKVLEKFLKNSSRIHKKFSRIHKKFWIILKTSSRFLILNNFRAGN